jgi:hypothetical protein
VTVACAGLLVAVVVYFCKRRRDRRNPPNNDDGHPLGEVNQQHPGGDNDNHGDDGMQ